ncbi:MAG: bifunctional DNA-binding transcriptional regulator/O6-methylguanine-DNA methyltransferase Ada [Ktedonobacteraceae bacterium]|nr:bifunctional DNA-binding transcriptional regulator/O6-methylguanine-DNA methyltransferase Ada [Ktedonobacteraceae bacterium]
MQEDMYWQAVLNRDATADGTFVFAVRSTGIYCRPSCPARRPRREHVVFFALPTVAEQAGFRPCLRCKPHEASSNGASTAHVELVMQLCAYIDEHLDEPLTLATLGAQVHMSPYHLQRVFKNVMSVTPRQYTETQRLGKLKAQLKEGESVTMALYDVGYSSSSRLYEGDSLGMTPTTYRHGGRGMHIRYSIVDCPLGRLLVAVTEKGICAVSIGSADSELETALMKEYPHAEVKCDAAELAEIVATLLRHLQGELPHLDLPLDVQATAFQRRVWEELRAIPYGTTRSYSEIAQALGDAHKARAVARACATNPVSLVIPCHRVVREDGSLGGYRWGIERKQRLLAQEQS